MLDSVSGLLPLAGNTRAPQAPQARKVIILNDSSRARGGATSLVLLAARELARSGRAVVLVCGDDAPDRSQLEAQGIEVVALGLAKTTQRSKSQAMRDGLHDRRVADVIGRVIEQHDSPSTVYHLHNWHQRLSPSALQALAPVARRTLLHAHDSFLACPNGAFVDYRSLKPCPLVPLSARCLATPCDRRSYVHKAWRSVRQMGVRRVLQDGLAAAQILLIHHHMRGLFARAGVRDEAMVVLPNPSTAWLAQRVRAEQNQTFLFVGRLEEEKGVLQFLAAAQQAKVQAVVVGEGSLRERAQALYPQTRFTGWLGAREIAALAQTARALVVPSLYPEPFGIVIPEALQSGVPVLLAETAYMAPDIQAQGYGALLRPRDIAAFAQLLEQFASPGHNATVAGMSERAFATSQQLTNSVAGWVHALTGLYDARTSSRAGHG